MTKTNGHASDKKALSEVEQAFLRAVRAGQREKMLELINSGVNINLSNPAGLTALHLASKEGYVDIVDDLIRRGSDINAPTKKGNTALHIASLGGHFDVVRRLLNAGAEVNPQTLIGFTPLYMAAQENHLDVVDLLLERGANQAITTEDGFTPLAVSLQQGHAQVVALLLERDSRSRGLMPALHIATRKDDVNAVSLLLNNPEVNVNHQTQHGFTPLHIAAHYGNGNVGKLLLKRGADVNFQAKNNITSLHMASKWGRIEMVRLLLSASALVDCQTRDGLTPVHCAARSGHADLVNILIDAGANPSATTRNGLTPLHMAAQGNHENVARVLVMRGASVNDRTGDMLSPLHVAAHCGNREVARNLLDNRCDVNARALNGFTPLHIACKKQKLIVVKLLLQYGAMLNIATESGLTPLHVAAFIGSAKIVELLLQHGARVDQATIRAETALHLAARNKQVAVARALIHHGATIDSKAKDGRTPLHIAVFTGSIELIKLLLAAKADPNLKARDDYTTMHIASREGHYEVLSLLHSAGADPSARTKKRFTPLHLAVKRGFLEASLRLIQMQPLDVNSTGQNNLTPLHVATHYNQLKTVQLLLDNEADTTCRANNGYTPLHIAVKQNHIDIVFLLLTYVSDQFDIVNAQSQSGFTPLQLAAQEGHTDTISLLLEHGANPNHQSRNGLTSLHLAAQENHIPVAEILIGAGAFISPLTVADYNPLHTACHFGQLDMVRFLLDGPNPPDINQQTKMEFTPLHLATQQGHSQVVAFLLERGADTNMRNKQGLTPAHIAQRKHYVAIFDVLKTVTTTVTSWEEEREELDGTLLVQQADCMGERPFSESDDEAVPSPAISHRVPHRSRSKMEEMSQPEDLALRVTPKGRLEATLDSTYLSTGENDDIWGQLEYMRFPFSDENTAEVLSPQMTPALETASPHKTSKDEITVRTEIQVNTATEQHAGDWDLEAENVNVVRKPISAGFLVSFVLDARGGLLQAHRYPNLRFLIPPNAVSGPLRLICRLIHPSRMEPALPLNDGDGYACRVLELGPVGTRFTSPILLEIPHYAFLTDRNRELIVYRSENGETWKEHMLDATDQAVQDTVCGYFDAVCTSAELRKQSIHRILTYDLPQYFALISRVRQELISVGPEGGVLTSVVVPEVQMQFPPGALQKKIRVGLQVHPIEQELVSRILGSRVSVSPIVTIEPRRRKFHKPISLTMPLPKTAIASASPSPNTRGAVGSPTLRLLCSMTGGPSPAVWEDITGTSQLTINDASVYFTSTVSSRLWLVDCANTVDVVELATRVYRESLAVPYIGRFILYGRRHHPEEAQLRCLCLTDDPVEKTLEAREGFQLVASGPPVEVLEGHPHWIETAGNLVPVAKHAEQLQLSMNAFRENRLSMLVRFRDNSQPPAGKVAFMRHPRPVLQNMDPILNRVTVLEAHLPSQWSPVDGPATLNSTDIDVIPANGFVYSKPEYESQIYSEDQQPQLKQSINGQALYNEMSPSADEPIGKSELDLRHVSTMIGQDWRVLAHYLGLSPNDIPVDYTADRSDEECAYAVLLTWQESQESERAAGTRLACVLRQIGREDVLNSCMLNISPVTSDEERDVAKRLLIAHDYELNVTESSGLGTSLDVITSPTGQAMSELGGQPITEFDDREREEDVIVPKLIKSDIQDVSDERRERPLLSPGERLALLQTITDLPVSTESLDKLSHHSGDAVVNEESIVPVESRHSIPEEPSDDFPTDKDEVSQKVTTYV